MAVLASGSFVRSEKAGQPSTSYSENITIPAGTNRRLLLLFLGGRFTADTQSVPTFGGSAMTVVGDTAPGGGATSASATRVVGYEFVDPPVGTAAFAVTNPSNVNDGVWYYLVIDESSGAASASAISVGPGEPITTATPAAGVESGKIGFVGGVSAAYSGGGVLAGTTQVGVVIAGHSGGYRIGANPGVGTWPSNQAAALTLVAPMGVSSATAVTLTGPSSGTVGSPSTNFTVGANGPITGTITVTPSDGGDGGTFSPTSVAISSGTPTATFTYTAANAGSPTATISVTNDGGLTNPAGIAYSASLPPATTMTIALKQSDGTTAAASITGIEYVILNAPTLGAATAMLDTGTGESTDGSGNLVLDITGLGLTPGQVRYVIAGKSNGTVGADFDGWHGPAAAA